MTIKIRNLYLYLALLCFAGILAIFVIDGYLGIYDKLSFIIQEREQVIDPDQWEQRWVKESGYSTGIRWGEPVQFKYQIDNRTFSPYSSTVTVTVWRGGEQLKQLLQENVTIPSFDQTTLTWSTSDKDFGEAALKTGEYGEYTIRITFGDIERKIILSYYPEAPGYPEKTPIPPVPAPEVVR